jgi:DNA-directed RNA polymerase subunit RPC12/RpoP
VIGCRKTEVIELENGISYKCTQCNKKLGEFVKEKKEHDK